MNPEDDEAVRRCLAGETAAYAELVGRYQDAVYNLAYRMTGSHAEAADAAQEAFIQAFRKLASFRPGASFRTWVMTICANRTRNRFRSEARRRAAVDRLAALEPEPGGAAASGDPRLDAVESELMRLPETLRTPLVLRHMEDLSYEEIARVLRIGMSAVKMRIKRAREALAAALRARRTDTA